MSSTHKLICCNDNVNVTALRFNTEEVKRGRVIGYYIDSEETFRATSNITDLAKVAAIARKIDLSTGKLVIHAELLVTRRGMLAKEATEDGVRLVPVPVIANGNVVRVDLVADHLVDPVTGRLDRLTTQQRDDMINDAADSIRRNRWAAAIREEPGFFNGRLWQWQTDRERNSEIIDHSIDLDFRFIRAPGGAVDTNELSRPNPAVTQTPMGIAPDVNVISATTSNLLASMRQNLINTGVRMREATIGFIPSVFEWYRWNLETELPHWVQLRRTDTYRVDTTINGVFFHNVQFTSSREATEYIKSTKMADATSLVNNVLNRRRDLGFEANDRNIHDFFSRKGQELSRYGFVCEVSEDWSLVATTTNRFGRSSEIPELAFRVRYDPAIAQVRVTVEEVN